MACGDAWKPREGNVTLEKARSQQLTATATAFHSHTVETQPGSGKRTAGRGHGAAPPGSHSRHRLRAGGQRRGTEAGGEGSRTRRRLTCKAGTSRPALATLQARGVAWPPGAPAPEQLPTGHVLREEAESELATLPVGTGASQQRPQVHLLFNRHIYLQGKG